MVHASRREYIPFIIFQAATIAGVAILFMTLMLLWREGHAVLSWDFVMRPWSHRDITSGGIAQAIIGSLFVGMGVTLFSFPVGVATAVYLTEYSRETLWKRVIQLAIQNLAGVPSVVYGLFGLVVFVNTLKFGTTLIAAILTLSVMTLPWVITASVEALTAVPPRFRHSSLALGATRWQTVWRVVLPSAFPGCITGGIVGIARALGETAPIIIVGATFYLSGFPTSPFQKFMALPYHVFILATQHSNSSAQSYAAATALVLILMTFCLTLGAIIVRYRLRLKKDW
ncbi:MAG: phosphate ABC transporter, permease protein PstA [Deltaproteobacteria bacterium RIFCSPLOWO2_02_FULL_46_8]|nr:MAG: phosphate ABC transporter, permease protein PstA [Deltaproteobacteria bacterium RIFCSPLOWO2_02_FULL_46_8]